MIYKTIIYKGGQITYQMTDALAVFFLPHMRPILFNYTPISAGGFVFYACILHQINKIVAETIFKVIIFLFRCMHNVGRNIAPEPSTKS